MPVPSNRNLEWIEIQDFSPGLWETGDWLVPAGAASVLTDAYPQPGGGLRAWFKPSTISLTGVGAGQRIIGLFGYGAGHRTLPTTATDLYLVSYDDTTGVPRLYRFDGTDAAQTQWTLIRTWVAGNQAPKEARFQAYKLAAGTIRIHVALGYSGADTGIWAANQADITGVQTFTKITGSIGTGPITVHQSRLLEGRGSQVFFTDPGGENFSAPTAGFIDVLPERNLSDNVAFLAVPPGDLIVAKAGAGWSSVQGDLADPIVRGGSQAHGAGVDQVLADTGAGIAFSAAAGGLYLTDSGYSFTRIDEQLVPGLAPASPVGIVATGDLVFHHHWLVAPRGYVYDMRTKSWFRASAPFNSNAYVAVLDPFNRQVICAGHTPRELYVFQMKEAESPSRANSYTWKSPSLRSSTGRQIEIREVQVVAKSYVGTSLVTVTVNGVARAVTGLAPGNHHLSFLYRERGETLDVQVVPSSGDLGNEAPSIEVIRIGQRPAHLIQ